MAVYHNDYPYLYTANLISSWNDGTTFDPSNLKCCGEVAPEVKGNCTLEDKKHFVCRGNVKMIPVKFVCDNVGNCDDSSDETYCDGEWFDCGDGENVWPPSYVCDGKNDCDDGSDEQETECGNILVNFLCSKLFLRSFTLSIQ